MGDCVDGEAGVGTLVPGCWAPAKEAWVAMANTNDVRRAKVGIVFLQRSFRPRRVSIDQHHCNTVATLLTRPQEN
jgi:hypothetical protein